MEQKKTVRTHKQVTNLLTLRDSAPENLVQFRHVELYLDGGPRYCIVGYALRLAGLTDATIAKWEREELGDSICRLMNSGYGLSGEEVLDLYEANDNPLPEKDRYVRVIEEINRLIDQTEFAPLSADNPVG